MRHCTGYLAAPRSSGALDSMRDISLMDRLQRCHDRLAAILGPEFEAVDVLRQAEEHRAYWRPSGMRVILPAESHVYTDSEDLALRLKTPPGWLSDLPKGFVRLVYCLGYGESTLQERPVLRSRYGGTPQFW